MKAYFEHRADAIYILQPEWAICNPKYVDLTLNPKHADFNAEYHYMPINGLFTMNKSGSIQKHWKNQGKNCSGGVPDDYIIQEGDWGWFNVWHYRHKKCHAEFKYNFYLNEFKRVFADAGIVGSFFTRTPNEYSGDDYIPWFIVATSMGNIKIGWHKRVIELDWSPSRCKKSADVLFPKESVTKEGRIIHAWGWDKATEYLRVIREATE